MRLRTIVRHVLSPSRNYRRFDALRRFLQLESKNARRAGTALAPAMLMAGMTSDKTRLYDRTRLARYWPDFNATGGHRVNVFYGALLEHKDVLHNLLARLEVGPSVLGLVRRGRFRATGGGDDLSLDQFVDELSAVLLRELDGNPNRPPRLLRRQDAVLTLDGVPVSEADLRAYFERCPVLVLQAPASLRGPQVDASDLLTLAMLRDAASAEPFCAFALRGSATPGTDLATALDRMSRLDLGNSAASVHPMHPDSTLRGALDRVTTVMRALPMLRAASFVLARDDQAFMVIDVTDTFDVTSAQRDGPLLDDPRIAAAYAAIFRRQGEPHRGEKPPDPVPGSLR